MIGMQYNLQEVFNSAIISRKPIVIVEGIDDIPLYDRIINCNGIIGDIIAVETIEGYSNGCRAVEQATSDLNGLATSRYAPEKFIVGIIDKDIKDFRNELPQTSSLLVLDFYSIESHFVNYEVIDYLLRVCTKGVSALYTAELKNKILNYCISNMELIYLASLEALKGSLDSSYSAEFNYSDKFGRLNDVNLSTRLYQKKNFLIDFALSLNIKYEVIHLKKFCKGKWLLEFFSKEVEESIKSLPSECGTNDVMKCRNCKSGLINNCMYRLTDGFSSRQLKELAKQVCSSSELSYIRTRVKNLNC